MCVRPMATGLPSVLVTLTLLVLVCFITAEKGEVATAMCLSFFGVGA